MTRFAPTGLLLTMLLLASFGQSADARVHVSPEITEIAAISGVTEVPGADLRAFQWGCMSLSQAVERAKRQHGGRIVSAETRGKNHVIKVLTRDNKVRTVRYPAC